MVEAALVEAALVEAAIVEAAPVEAALVKVQLKGALFCGCGGGDLERQGAKPVTAGIRLDATVDSRSASGARKAHCSYRAG